MAFFPMVFTFESLMFYEVDTQIEYWTQVARTTFSHTHIKYSELEKRSKD